MKDISFHASPIHPDEFSVYDIHPEWSYADKSEALAHIKRVDDTAKELGWSRAEHWYVHRIVTWVSCSTEVELE